MKTILLPVDGSENSSRAVQRAIEIVKDSNDARLLVVTAYPPIVSGNVKSFFSAEDIQSFYQDEGNKALEPARAILDKAGIAYAFHDYKIAGIDKAHLDRWSEAVGWEILLNRAGTTFKKLPDADRENLTEKKALALMLAQPSMIKRPVLESGGKLVVGFKPDIYEKEVGKGGKR